MKMMTTRKVLTLMLILSMFSIMGCGSESRDEKAAKKIVSSLQEKYGEEFVLDSIGGGWGTMNNNTLKAIVRPKNDETINIPVEITKDLKKVYDKYLNQAVARNEKQSIEEMAKSLWSDSKVVVANDTKMTYPEHNDTGMTYTEFLELYPMNTQLIMIYLNVDNYMDSKGNVNQEAEIRKYSTFSEVLAEKKYFSSHVSITYLMPKAYDRFEEALRSDDTVNKFYRSDEEKTGSLNVVTRIGFKVDKNGVLLEDQNQLKSNFETWKEERERSVKVRGGM